jgi:hypothetical protein
MCNTWRSGGPSSSLDKPLFGFEPKQTKKASRPAIGFSGVVPGDQRISASKRGAVPSWLSRIESEELDASAQDET